MWGWVCMLSYMGCCWVWWCLGDRIVCGDVVIGEMLLLFFVCYCLCIIILMDIISDVDRLVFWSILKDVFCYFKFLFMIF